MAISPGKPKSSTAAGKAASGDPAFFKILHRKILYPRRFLVALLASVVFLGAVSVAQEERPQIAPGERKVPRKKDAGPRALALLQLTSSGKASLLPITILINGKFYDATAYKANPIPMALESGTVYEGFRTGRSLGLFTVGKALHSNSPRVPTPWIGTGAWVPAGSEQADTAHKAEAVPVGIDTSDGPPRLTKNAGAAKETQPASTGSPSAMPPTTGPSTSGDDGPPRLSKKDPAPPSAPSPGSAPAGSSQPSPGSSPSSPTSDSKTSDAKGAESKTATPRQPDSNSGADDAHRPRLRRGIPNQPLPEEKMPGYSQPGSKGATTATGSASGAEGTAAQEPIQLVPAVSDASGPDARSYKFEWLKDEEGERRTQMIALAKEQVRAYLDARAQGRIMPQAAPKPSGAQAARRLPPKKAPEPILENVQMTTYDPWGNNQPVIVLSAVAHMPAAPAAGGQGTSESDTQYSIMLVARTDIYSNLKKLYSGVTDRYHLDITPRLELIDAVDADGDGRGELLFRETSDAGTGYVIYRPTADKLWKMFDSLNPE